MPSLIKPSAKFRRPESCCPSSANILVSILVILVIFVILIISIILVVLIILIFMILIILKNLTILILIQLVTSGDVTVGAHLPTLAPLSVSESKSKLVPLVSLTRWIGTVVFVNIFVYRMNRAKYTQLRTSWSHTST